MPDNSQGLATFLSWSIFWLLDSWFTDQRGPKSAEHKSEIWLTLAKSWLVITVLQQLIIAVLQRGNVILAKYYCLAVRRSEIGPCNMRGACFPVFRPLCSHTWSDCGKTWRAFGHALSQAYIKNHKNWVTGGWEIRPGVCHTSIVKPQYIKSLVIDWFFRTHCYRAINQQVIGHHPPKYE